MRLSLRLFGPFRASLDGRDLRIGSRRSQALLVMLARAPTGAIGRDRLAATLWPDRAEEQSRASLRQELSALRRALGPAGEIVSGDATSVRIDRGALDPDVGQPGDGEFLEGLDLRSEPFDDWRRAETAGLSDVPVSAVAPPDIFVNPSLLVAAFVPASDAPDDATFATGLVYELRTSLSLWRWFPVIGPEAIGWQTEQAGNLRDTAQSVGATYVLSGAVRRAGDRIRVSVSLMDVASGHLVWTEPFDGDLSEVFEVQERISQAVVARVTPEIGRAETARVAGRTGANPSAWHLVAQTDDLDRIGGEGYGTPEANAAQVPLLEEAVRLDPAFARAWARLARYHFRAGIQGWNGDRAGALQKALEYSERAITEDPTEWEAQCYRAFALSFGMQTPGPALHFAREAARLNPSAPIARFALGCTLEWLGEPEEALTHLRSIFQLNPNFPNRSAVLGDISTCELLCGRVDEAAEVARQLRLMAPQYGRGMQRVVVSLAHAGAIEEAKSALAEVRAMLPNFDEAYIRETYPYSRPSDLEVIFDGLRLAGWNG